MFALLNRRRQRKQSIRRRSVQLTLELLESRDCPSAPQLTLTALPLGGHQAQLSGSVADEHPSGVTITFHGAVSGTTMADASGQYNFVAEAAGLGAVYAVGVDQELLSSDTVAADLTSTAPSLALAIAQGAQQTVILSGQVDAADPAGLTVTFSGVVAGSVVTNADGSFYLETQASGLGTLQASTVDSWGQSSNTAEATVAGTAPAITSFQAVEAPNRYWTFQGQVADDNAAGLVVRFGGLSSLSGQTATVAADGSFLLTVQLQDGETGTATAQTTNGWGLDSGVAQTDVVSTAPSLTLAIVSVDQQTVVLSGQVSDSNPNGVTVTFSGVVAGSVVTNADGSFRLEITASALGDVQAVAVDSRGLSSNTAEVTLASNPPAITGFQAIEGPNHFWTFQGQVLDDHPAGLVMRFGGLSSLSGQMATVAADGSFLLTVQLQAGETGTATAQTTNGWGLDSGAAQADVVSTAPTMTLTITYGEQGAVILSGWVNEPNPNGVTVTFSGVATGSVVTNADGSFSLQTTASGLGDVQAVAVDSRGLSSDVAEVSVAPSPPTIIDFVAIEETEGIWTFQGKVSGANPAGLVVNFGGLPSLQGRTATVRADGSFDVSVQLQNGEEGTATVQTTDAFGQNSNVSLALVSRTGP